MAMNYQHRWGKTEDGRQKSRLVSTRNETTIQIATCPCCAHQQSALRLADYGCPKCKLTSLEYWQWAR